MRDVILPNCNIKIETNLFGKKIYKYNYSEGTTIYIYTCIVFEFDEKDFSNNKTTVILKKFLKDLIKIFQ